MNKAQQINALETQMRNVVEAIARVEAMPEDDYPDGAIVTFTTRYYYNAMYGVRRGGPKKFTFAALKVDDGWYLTGNCPHAVDWETLLKLVDGNPIWYVTEMEEQT